jgi:hypothetical protein
MYDIDEILVEKYKKNKYDRNEEVLNNVYKILNTHLSKIISIGFLLLCCVVGYFIFLYILIVENNDKLQQAKGFIVPAIILFLEKIKKK